MPWVDAILKGQKVLARARGDGTFDAQGGRVEVRYRPNDGRSYRASVANLTIPEGARTYDDAHCGPAEATDAAKKRPTGSGGGPASGASGRREDSRSSSSSPAPRTSDASAWVAYTDGACSGNPGPAGLGVVVVPPRGSPAEGYEFLGTATNNIAEVTAILRAVEAIPADGRSILVHTDSKYAIGVLTQGWKAKANGELIAKTKAALKGRPIRMIYVPGHAGVPLNERADELAREAIRSGGKRSLGALSAPPVPESTDPPP
jgi:ribonuclease HI